MKCRQALENPTPCGRTICCAECEEFKNCDEACLFLEDHKSSECKEVVNEGNELIAFESATLAITQTIATIAKEKERLDAEDKKMRQELEEAMNAYGIKDFENQFVKITHIDATTKTTVDSKKLKAELPDVYQKYSKVSNVKASVRISVKG